MTICWSEVLDYIDANGGDDENVKKSNTMMHNTNTLTLTMTAVDGNNNVVTNSDVSMVVY